MQDVAIFWDYENCSPPSNIPGYIVANNIRLLAQAYGSVKSLKAYLEITDQPSSARALSLRSELQASGVSLIDCPHNGRKDVADKMIIVDMLAYAIDNPAPSVIVLISGDKDFAYALSILRLRHYQVILVTLSNAHPSLKAQSSVCVDWHNEIIDPVGRPPARTTTNPVGPVTTPTTCRDSPQGQSPPLQPSQDAQEIADVECVDHGDLLHYLRTATRYKRPSRASFNTSIRQEACYERSRQDASSTVEVELDYIRPSSVRTFTTHSTNSSVSNDSSPAIRATPDPIENQSSTVAPGSKASMTGPIDAQLPFFTLSGKPPSMPSPKVNNPVRPPPTLFPSAMQPETPYYSPVAHYAVIETDIPDDNSTSEIPFVYPVRPSSAPHSLPSQSPLVPPISAFQPLASETTSALSVSPKAEVLSMLSEGLTTQPSPHSFTSQEMPRILISAIVNSTSLCDSSIAAIADIPNNPESAPPDVDSTNQTSTPDTNSNEVDQLPVRASVNQASPSISLTGQIAYNLPPVMVSVTQVGAGPSVLKPKTIVDKPSPIVPFTTSCSSKPEVVVPPIFKILVDTLNIEKARGNTRPLRTWIADALYRSGFKCEDAGVSKFSQYTALAEKQGIVELGSHKTEAWISLKYQDAPPVHVVPPIFKILVDALKVQHAMQNSRPLRSNIALAIARNGLTYKEAGVERFGQYAALAEKDGIIELGGREGDAWISLKPEYRNASTN